MKSFFQLIFVSNLVQVRPTVLLDLRKLSVFDDSELLTRFAPKPVTSISFRSKSLKVILAALVHSTAVQDVKIGILRIFFTKQDY